MNFLTNVLRVMGGHPWLRRKKSDPRFCEECKYSAVRYLGDGNFAQYEIEQVEGGGTFTGTSFHICFAPTQIYFEISHWQQATKSRTLCKARNAKNDCEEWKARR